MKLRWVRNWEFKAFHYLLVLSSAPWIDQAQIWQLILKLNCCLCNELDWGADVLLLCRVIMAVWIPSPGTPVVLFSYLDRMTPRFSHIPKQSSLFHLDLFPNPWSFHLYVQYILFWHWCRAPLTTGEYLEVRKSQAHSQHWNRPLRQHILYKIYAWDWRWCCSFWGRRCWGTPQLAPTL